ncbi:MAG: hypothetical protein BHW09_02610 [Clostridium sp. CAG:245_30_32]|jgi:hypothetical protein|nr:hypothetical protein [Clostridium sp.]MCQ5167223.1 hypothetical protein [Roseburia hominis]OKZ88549.1 MAG: hypothetical protein BHW09_02610 [Clostridium sp. CAG:245_30_32]
MKIKKILCFLLAAVLVIEGGEGLVSRKAEAAINYTGSYSKERKSNGYRELYVATLKKKSAYKGKLVLSKMNSSPNSDDRIVGYEELTIYKVGKDSYEGKKKKMTIKIKVYKKKIVIKQKGKTVDLYINMSGTYKK